MTTDGPKGVEEALAFLPGGAFLLTSAWDGARGGVLVRWVQRCAQEPLLLAVAAPKGHNIEPIIRDSRSFGICVVDPADRLLTTRFSVRYAPDENPDLFDGLPLTTLVTGAPLVTRGWCGFDCEMVRHVDLDADHELYVGRVLASRVFRSTPKKAAAV